MLTVDFRILSPTAGELVLDAGCGEGRHSFALYRLGCKVFALDMDMTSLRKASYVLKEMGKKGEGTGSVMTIKGDGLILPFKDKTFDKVICAEVLEHIPNDKEVVLELVRVLKPGGTIAVTVPTPFTEAVYGWLSQEYFQTPGGHIRIYTPTEISQLLTGCGLEIFWVSFAHSFHSLYWVLRCLCGLHNQQAPLPRIYHRFLHKVVLHHELSRFERSCNYLFPKSIVLYGRKGA